MKAKLILANGMVFHGKSIGSTAERVCEMVFNKIGRASCRERV